jgi:pyridinium-3,5-biscarboxylic acid mononucleotide synthase
VSTGNGAGAAARSAVEAATPLHDDGAGATDRTALLALMRSVAAGTATPEQAIERLSWLPTELLGGGGEAGGATPFARLDHHRAIRNGFPEVVFCQGKTPEQTVAICERLAARDGGFLATRADDGTRAALASAFPTAANHALGRIVHLASPSAPPVRTGRLLVASAGTADLPVAEEAVVTSRALGCEVEAVYDIGVAGLHRLLAASATLARAEVIIVVAGMEGALASVVGGLVRVPVIAVPTSVGYGASFGGVAALLAMLNSCAAGVTVVNIDNGFGAACAAARILQHGPVRH